MLNRDWRSEYKNYILAGKLQEAKKIISDNIGDIYLYKYYRGTKRQLDTVINKRFWLSNARYFNDPYDSLSLINVRNLSNFDGAKSGEIEKIYEEYRRQIEENRNAHEIQSRIFVTCFSEITPTSLHMWSYYADEHKGFCVKYSLKKLMESDIYLWPVIYVDSDEWTIDSENEDYNTLVSLRKEKGWEHEKEWRIIHIDSAGSKNGIEIDGIAPEAIYVGCRDQMHINDNYALQNKLEKVFEEEKVRQFVWENGDRKISLNEIMDPCKKQKVPLYLMREKEGKIGLYSQKIQY